MTTLAPPLPPPQHTLAHFSNDKKVHSSLMSTQSTFIKCSPILKGSVSHGVFRIKKKSIRGHLLSTMDFPNLIHVVLRKVQTVLVVEERICGAKNNRSNMPQHSVNSHVEHAHTSFGIVATVTLLLRIRLAHGKFNRSVELRNVCSLFDNNVGLHARKWCIGSAAEPINTFLPSKGSRQDRLSSYRYDADKTSCNLDCEMSAVYYVAPKKVLQEEALQIPFSKALYNHMGTKSYGANVFRLCITQGIRTKAGRYGARMCTQESNTHQVPRNTSSRMSVRSGKRETRSLLSPR